MLGARLHSGVDFLAHVQVEIFVLESDLEERATNGLGSVGGEIYLFLVDGETL